MLGAAAAIVLAAGSTVAIAAVSSALEGRPGPASRDGVGQFSQCSVPALPGAVIDVALADMGGQLGYGRHGGMMGAGSGPMPGGWGMAGMMIVRVSPTSAAAGTVSLRVVNVGAVAHELIVLPLALDAKPGQRTVRADGTVDEAGSLGEVANTCGGSDGDGILPGGSGWTTIQLAPGRYELLCNLPGHYAAGMYAELDVNAA